MLTGEPALESRLRPAAMHETIRHRLEDLATAWGLRPADAHRLAQQIRSHTYEPGEVILPTHAQVDFWGLIVRGLVAVYEPENQPDRPVAVLLPGSTLGNLLPTDGRSATSTLQAYTRCEILLLCRADIEALARGQRAERSWTGLWRVLLGGALVWGACLLTILLLRLPAVRRVSALVPMAVGEWCNRPSREMDRCVEWSWMLAASLAPEDPNPQLGLGTLYFEQGHMEAAEQSFEAVRALAPDLAEVHNNLGLIYARRGEQERAIAAFQQALDLEPGTAAVEHNLGLSLQATQAYGEALTHYRRAVAFGEPAATTLANMAIGYYELGQLDQAANSARQALDHDPKMAPAHAVLGAVALKLEGPEAAVPHLRQAIVLDPGSSPAYYYLGLAYEAMGQPVEAMAAFEQALAHTRDPAIQEQSRHRLAALYSAPE